MVDAPVSKTGGGNPVSVRIRPSAPHFSMSPGFLSESISISRKRTFRPGFAGQMRSTLQHGTRLNSKNPQGTGRSICLRRAIAAQPRRTLSKWFRHRPDYRRLPRPEQARDADSDGAFPFQRIGEICRGVAMFWWRVICHCDGGRVSRIPQWFSLKAAFRLVRKQCYMLPWLCAAVGNCFAGGAGLLVQYPAWTVDLYSESQRQTTLVTDRRLEPVPASFQAFEAQGVAEHPALPPFHTSVAFVRGAGLLKGTYVIVELLSGKQVPHILTHWTRVLHWGRECNINSHSKFSRAMSFRQPMESMATPVSSSFSSCHSRCMPVIAVCSLLGSYSGPCQEPNRSGEFPGYL